MTTLIAATLAALSILLMIVKSRKNKSRSPSTPPIQFISGNNPFEKFVLTNRERAHRVGFLS
ncbi:MAG: hypothetical protein G8345_02430 [Magnetococcales bacterium]|nr:hypothetical protein [Magnetococcales bacterium]NGZ25727.1 hypothetical protein [Magnetococcales bacterium]